MAGDVIGMSDAEQWAEHGDAQTEAMLALEGELQARADEIARLRRWLRAIVEQTEQVEAPCGWCVEIQGWATDALLGRPYPGAGPG